MDALKHWQRDYPSTHLIAVDVYCYHYENFVKMLYEGGVSPEQERFEIFSMTDDRYRRMPGA